MSSLQNLPLMELRPASERTPANDANVLLLPLRPSCSFCCDIIDDNDDDGGRANVGVVVDELGLVPPTLLPPLDDDCGGGDATRDADSCADTGGDIDGAGVDVVVVLRPNSPRNEKPDDGDLLVSRILPPLWGGDTALAGAAPTVAEAGRVAPVDELRFDELLLMDVLLLLDSDEDDDEDEYEGDGANMDIDADPPCAIGDVAANDIGVDAAVAGLLPTDDGVITSAEVSSVR
jgi:hypothetical protein